MAKDLTVFLEDKPGSMATMGEVLGNAMINISGSSSLIVEDKGVIHILVEEPEKAREILSSAGIEVGEERDVLVVDVNPVPGELGRQARALARVSPLISRNILFRDGCQGNGRGRGKVPHLWRRVA